MQKMNHADGAIFIKSNIIRGSLGCMLVIYYMSKLVMTHAPKFVYPEEHQEVGNP
jgi:hypothetical protein